MNCIICGRILLLIYYTRHWSCILYRAYEVRLPSIVSGPKLPKTGGISTDDPADDSTGHFILVYVYIQLGKKL